jgi:hypothetical protein
MDEESLYYFKESFDAMALIFHVEAFIWIPSNQGEQT